MAYTYNDFLKAASGSNMMERFDQNDLEITKSNPEYGLSLLRLMKDRDGAVSTEARLLTEEAISQLKSNYALPGSSRAVSAMKADLTLPSLLTADTEAGSGTTKENLPTITEPVTTSSTVEAAQSSAAANTQQSSAEATAETAVSDIGFSYDNESDYQRLLRNITNPTKFSYDPESDPAWSAYRKSYLLEGDRATQNALARAAAATGGIPSTYALTAAQQAGASYGEQLSAIIPTLEQNAYDRYLNDLNQKLTALQALETDRTDAYSKYMDAYQVLLNNIQQNTQTELTDTTDGGSEGSLTAEDIAYIQNVYPSGAITNPAIWADLVERFGEEALLAAGFTNASETSGQRLGLIDGAIAKGQNAYVLH